MTRRSVVGLVAAALATLTILAYWHVGEFGFVNLDDDAYVEFAPMVNKGVRPASLVWAFTAVHTANWHPFTSISHMIDCDLFGIQPAPMHWENVVWHVVNATLVFLVWRALTQTLWRSALVAALFALHPLHTESVAWISSRKDLLCTFFWLLGFAAYVRWVRAPSAGRYVLVALALAAALLAKPMAVTLPATLLLFDYWPLGRWNRASWPGLLREKIPLFVIVVLHSVVTFIVQHQAGAADYAERIAPGARLGNAVVSYVRYLAKTFWPEHLSPLYWHPGHWPWLSIIGAILLLAAICIAAWRAREARPWFLFGWLWFLGTLVPVIGLVQVGAQAMADRYTYLPLLGVFTLLVWLGGEMVERWPRWRVSVSAVAAAVLAGCLLLTQRQASAWSDSITLYRRSIAAGEDNPAIRYLLATALAAAHHPEEEVVAQYRRALELRPDYVNAITQLALIAMSHQRHDEALTLLEKEVRLEPDNVSLRGNLAAYWVIHGEVARGTKLYEEALQMRPRDVGIHRELARLALGQNHPDEARAHYEAAIEANPWEPLDWANLGVLLVNAGRLADGRHCLERALWIDPGNDFARRSLAIVAELAKSRKG